jgi:hypothetical protein
MLMPLLHDSPKALLRRLAMLCAASMHIRKQRSDVKAGRHARELPDRRCGGFIKKSGGSVDAFPRFP